MQPTTHSQKSPVGTGQVKPGRGITDLANDILTCIEGLTSREAALLVMDDPVHMANPHGFPADVLTELQLKVEADLALLKSGASPRIPRIALSDKTSIHALPLVHAGLLESILYVHGGIESAKEVTLQQWRSLDPICEVSAGAIAHHRSGKSTGRKVVLAAESWDDSTPPTGLQASVDKAPWMFSRLLGLIAHDIRTPITVLRGYLKMMLSERAGTLSPEQKECLEGALNSMNQLNSLTSSISGASGIIEQIQVEELSLADDLWRPCWKEVQSQAEERGLNIVEQFPDTPLQVCGDREILSDVLQKMTRRSIGLAEPNTGMKVELSARKTGDVVLRLHFNGSSRQHSGQDVVSELLPLVFLHGGKLTLDSRNEDDSSFTMMLPGKDA